MAFTYKKLKFSEAPNLAEESSQINDEPQNKNEVIKKFTLDTSFSKKELTYNGVPLSILETSGFNSLNFLKSASNTPIEKKKFNTALLDLIPLEFIMQQFKAHKINDNSFEFKNIIFNFKFEQNKWYDTNNRFGHVKAISLTKHLIALQENMTREAEIDNDKTLFISACKKLSQLESLVNIENSNIDKKPSITENNPTIEDRKPSNLNSLNTPKNENPINWKQIIPQIDAIPLSIVLEHIGASDNEDGRRGQWKIWSTGENIQITSDFLWNSWNYKGNRSKSGGKGAISLMAYFIAQHNNIDDGTESGYKQARVLAINELIKVFGKDLSLGNLSLSNNTPLYKEPFSMPIVIPEKLLAVKNYLKEKRFIPNWIIEKQIKSKHLFAGFPSDWEEDPALKSPEKFPDEKVWAIFLAPNANAAEMRGIARNDNYAKMLAKGSDKDFGGFLVKAENSVKDKTIAACEAAIDAMSYHSYFPGRTAISCMGVNFNLAVQTALETLSHDGYNFSVAFDNDNAGIEATVQFRETLISQIGNEEYNSMIKNHRINYFELGLECFKETYKNKQIFYFDAKNNETGITAVKMFQEILIKNYSKEIINKLINQGQIKYLNIAPNYHTIKNISLAVDETINLLKSGKPYYLVLKQSEPDEKEQVKKNREDFEHLLEKKLKTDIHTFINNGSIIYDKKILAKDWNEFLIFKIKNDSSFKNQLIDYETKFSETRTENKIKP